MIIRQDKSFETRSDKPNTNWYEGEDIFIVDETTEEGQLMVKNYTKNYPFVDFEHNGEFVTKVILLEKPIKPIDIVGKELELIKNELGVWGYIYVDISLTEIELLQQKVAEQDMVIEGLMFVIIPEMMGGGM